MLVEAAWQAVRGPGPLRAFFQRIARRRGNHIAAVAVARKLAVIIWHLLTRGEDYAWVRPALHAKKLRDLELRSGKPARRGQRGPAYAYNLSRVRARGAAPGRAGRDGLPTSDRGMDPTREAGTHGRRKGGATMRLRGRALHLMPGSSPRGRPWAKAE